MKSLGIRWAALTILLVAVGCEGPGGPPTIGQVIPDFRAVSLDGDSLSLSELRGSTVLLNMWATWCVPCRTETPFLQSVYEEHRDQGFRIVGVSVDSESARSDVEEFVREMGVTYDILLDPAMESMNRYFVIGLPATYLVDAEGVIRFARLGPLSESDPEFWRALEETL